MSGNSTEKLHCKNVVNMPYFCFCWCSSDESRVAKIMELNFAGHIGPSVISSGWFKARTLHSAGKHSVMLNRPAATHVESLVMENYAGNRKGYTSKRINGIIVTLP